MLSWLASAVLVQTLNCSTTLPLCLQWHYCNLSKFQIFYFFAIFRKSSIFKDYLWISSISSACSFTSLITNFWSQDRIFKSYVTPCINYIVPLDSSFISAMFYCNRGIKMGHFIFRTVLKTFFVFFLWAFFISNVVGNIFWSSSI